MTTNTTQPPDIDRAFLERLQGIIDTDRTTLLAALHKVNQRVGRLEQRLARELLLADPQSRAAMREPETPIPVPKHERKARPTQLDTAAESVRVDFALHTQLKHFHATDCVPIQLQKLYLQSGLTSITSTEYIRYLNAYIETHHPELATGPRRLLDPNDSEKRLQARCLYRPRIHPSKRNQLPIPVVTLAKQVEQFRETAKPVLVCDLYRATTINISRYNYIQVMTRYIDQEHPDLDVVILDTINPKTHKPFKTPWLIRRPTA
jgi:hypothetical protein